MKSIDIVRMAYGNLFRRKVRAFLTIIGVFIGTMAIVVMMSLGIGMKEAMTKQMESWGDLNMITVNPGRSYNYETGEMRGDEQHLNDDAVTLIQGQPGVVSVMPMYQISGSAKYGKKEGYLSLYGVDPETFASLGYTIAEGRMIDNRYATSIVVGWQVVNQFWDPDDRGGGMMFYGYGGGNTEQPDSREMINNVVYIELRNQYNYEIGARKQPLTVIGVLEGEYKDHAYNAYVPIESMKKWRDFINDKSFMTQEQREEQERQEKEMIENGWGSVRDPNDYDQIIINCKDVKAAREVAATLREMGYNLWTIADSMEGVEQQSLIIQAVLGGIGAITLLVATIGIANTMIMSIYERTREIGVMKVIGADVRDIRKMFLMEAGLIGVCGGIMGLICSYGASFAVNQVAGDYMGTMPDGTPLGISSIPPWLALFALGFAFFIGIVAGWYPARRASKLSPITAIRNE